jgi:hypothetical protein
MKRDFLRGLTIEVDGKQINLSDAVIDSIISENGKDIEATKAKADKSQEIENLKSELLAKDKLIEESNVQIQKFKEMDVDGIKAAAEEWKNKYTEFENQTKAEKEAYQKQLQDQQYDFAVRELTGKHKFTNDFVKNAFVEEFKKQGLKLDESGNFLGADDYIKGFQEKNPGVFAVEAPPSNEPRIQFSAATSGNPAPEAKVPLVELMKAKNAGQTIDPNQFNIVQK